MNFITFCSSCWEEMTFAACMHTEQYLFFPPTAAVTSAAPGSCSETPAFQCAAELLSETQSELTAQAGADCQSRSGDCAPADGSCRVHRPLYGYCETAGHTVSSDMRCVLVVASNLPASTDGGRVWGSGVTVALLE